MSKFWIVFPSSTSAGRLKKLANINRISGIRMLQTPRDISQNGCTYALLYTGDNIDWLLQLAAEYDIRHGNVYRELSSAHGKREFEQIH